ncbi:unnamed protein product [Ambrosiozyma monospora]|uniref:Unnamed protein product n=1 Tax=Ambrosiozyma monospora TaxID=43982 RepID=A0ACB5SVI5_AMBMO|nr:unnamed protein product [Ambrosiozyma monospora]
MTIMDHPQARLFLSSYLAISTAVAIKAIRHSLYNNPLNDTVYKYDIHSLTLDQAGQLLPKTGPKYVLLLSWMCSIIIVVQLLLFRLISDTRTTLQRAEDQATHPNMENNRRDDLFLHGDLNFEAFSEIHIKLGATAYNYVLAASMLIEDDPRELIQKGVGFSAMEKKSNILGSAIMCGLILLKQCHLVMFYRSNFVFEKESLMIVETRRDPATGTGGARVVPFKDLIFNRGVLDMILFWVVDLAILVQFVQYGGIFGTYLTNVLGLDYFLVFMDTLDVTFKYLLNLWEVLLLRYWKHQTPEDEDDDVWEPKSWITKAVSLVLVMIKVYVVGLMVIVFTNNNKLPMYFIYPTISVVFLFFRKFKELTESLRVPLELQKNLQDPSVEEVKKAEVCSICYDDLSLHIDDNTDRHYPKKVHCGHIYHFGCLKRWLRRSNKCPFCSSKVIDPKLAKKN